MRGSGSVVRLCAHRLVRVDPPLSWPAGLTCEGLDHSSLDTLARLWSPDFKTGIVSMKPFHGTRFTFIGKTYVKVALNMAEDEKRHGHIFMYEMQVEPIESDAPTGKPETT